MIDYIKTYLQLKYDLRAVTAVEYGLIAGLISVVIITAVTLLGNNLNGVFNNIAGKVGSA